MTRVTETGQLVSGDGQPVTAGDAGPPRGEHAGVTFTRAEDSTMAKADRDGIYTVGRTHIKVRKGDVIPAGAERIAPASESSDAEQRAKGAAPENKAKAGAPETKAKGA